MPKISQRLITVSPQMAALIKSAARKKMRISAVRGMDGNRARDWIILFSTSDARHDEYNDLPADGTINTAKFITIFDANNAKFDAHIYVHRDGPATCTVADVAQWIQSQPDGFEDAVLHPMIDDAVDNGWLIEELEYRDNTAHQYPDGTPLPDMLKFRAQAHNFNRPSYSDEVVHATANEGKPEWNHYMHSPSEAARIVRPAPVANVADIQALLGQLAPTLPKPTLSKSTPPKPKTTT